MRITAYRIAELETKYNQGDLVSLSKGELDGMVAEVQAVHTDPFKLTQDGDTFQASTSSPSYVVRTDDGSTFVVNAGVLDKLPEEEYTTYDA
ncbi:HVA1 family protein [Halosegnis longus]|uniref:HVA1 family protein n=1 Tax=Halosegnis longus TaxID=2216012 RepID=UPI00129E10D3|nr:HVA1 family protein [Halosegnis longus]